MPLSPPVEEALFRPRWAGGWAISRLLFGLAALYSHLLRGRQLDDALSISTLSFNAGPLHLQDTLLLPAPAAWLFWALGLLGLGGLLRGGAWAKPGLLLWALCTGLILSGAGLNVRVPERFAAWAVLVLLVAPIERPSLLQGRATGFPRLLLLVIMGSLYLSTGLMKALEEPHWWDGSALAYDLLDRWHAGGALAVWLSGQPGLCMLMSLCTLGFELGFVFFVGFRWSNPLILLAGVAMHLSIALLMDVGSLGHMALAFYPVLLEPELGERLWTRLRSSFPRGRP